MGYLWPFGFALFAASIVLLSRGLSSRGQMVWVGSAMAALCLGVVNVLSQPHAWVAFLAFFRVGIDSETWGWLTVGLLVVVAIAVATKAAGFEPRGAPHKWVLILAAVVLLLGLLADLWEIRSNVWGFIDPPPVAPTRAKVGPFVLFRTLWLCTLAGARLAAWLPLGVVVAALWSCRSKHGRFARAVLCCASWPAWLLGVALFEYGTTRLFVDGYRIFELVGATAALKSAAGPLLLLVLASGLALWPQLPAHPPRWWRGVSALALVGGIAAFAATRAGAHDIAYAIESKPNMVVGALARDTIVLAAGQPCIAGQEHAIEVIVHPTGVTMDGHPAEDGEVEDYLGRRLERAADMGTPLVVQVTAHREADTGRIDAVLARLRANRADLVVERVHVLPLPTISSRVVDGPIHRALSCVVVDE